MITPVFYNLNSYKLNKNATSKYVSFKALYKQNDVPDNINDLINEAQLNSPIGLNSIAGYDDVKGFIRKIFIDEVTKEKAKIKSVIPKAILLYGPTGCGKSKLVDSIASEVYPEKSVRDKYFVKIDTSDDADEVIDAISEAQENAYDNFKGTNNRTIILLDEIEAVANNKDKTTAESIKAAIDLADSNYCTFFLTSNYPANINPDILGSNKVEYLISIDPPDKKNMAAVLQHYFKRLSVKNINYNDLADELIKGQRNGRFSNSGIQHMYNLCKDIPKLQQSDIVDIIKNTKPNILQEEYCDYINNRDKFEEKSYNNISVNNKNNQDFAKKSYLKNAGIILGTTAVGASVGFAKYNLHTYPKAVRQHKASRQAINNFIKESLKNFSDL